MKSDPKRSQLRSEFRGSIRLAGVWSARALKIWGCLWIRWFSVSVKYLGAAARFSLVTVTRCSKGSVIFRYRYKKFCTVYGTGISDKYDQPPLQTVQIQLKTHILSFQCIQNYWNPLRIHPPVLNLIFQKLCDFHEFLKFFKPIFDMLASDFTDLRIMIAERVLYGFQ